MKIAIIYASQTGNTEEGSRSLGAFQIGAVVQAKNLDEYADQLEALGANVAEAVVSHH